MTRRIAITGASGFIGRHLIEAVRRHGLHPVVLLRRHPADLLKPESELEIILGDLGDRASLERLVKGADAIIHLAGIVKATDAASFHDVNALGTERLLLAAAHANPAAPLVHVSSLAAREPGLSPYAASKRDGENHVAALAGRRPWAILRPPAVYGPGDLELLPFFRCASMGFLAVPGLADARFSLIHVADLAEAIASLAAGTWAGTPIAEIDDGAPAGHDWPEVRAVMAGIARRKLRSFHVPRQAMLPIAIGLAAMARITGRPATLSPAKLNELYHPDWVARSSVADWAGTWRPRIGIQEGFASCWEWYLRQGLIT